MVIILASQSMAQVRVESTKPRNGEKNVSPSLNRIVVKFSGPVRTDSYSFVVAGKGETPEITGDPRFQGDRVCILPVKLKPNTTYSIGINSKRRKGFVGKDGVPVTPYVLTFQTGVGKAKKKPRKSKRTGAAEKPSSPSRQTRGTQGGKVAAPSSATVFHLYFDKTEGAFWVLVPHGWKVSGGTVRQLFQPARFNLEVVHPSGWAGYRFIPTPYYMEPNEFYPMGAMDNNGNVYLPLMPPEQYLTQIVVPWLYKNGQAKVEDSSSLPEVAQSFSNFSRLVEQQTGIQVRFAAAQVRLSVNEGRAQFIHRLVAIQRSLSVMGKVVWETLLIQIRLRADKKKQLEPILMTSLGSFEINPRWAAALNQAEAVRGAQAMRYQEEIIQIHERMMQNRAAVNDAVAHSIALELGGQAEYTDPETGETRTLLSGYQYTWTDGNGNFFQSNSPDFDPNKPEIQEKFGLNGHFRIMKRK